jgi:hypothetical protein
MRYKKKVIIMAENKEASPEKGVSKDEQIGFHKGALSTLAKERTEMMKILNIVEQLMQMHVKALQELGIDLTKAQKSEPVKQSKPIDDLLK